MKTRAFIGLALLSLFLAAPAFADSIPPKTEWSFGGTYINPDDGKAKWAVTSDLLFPMGTGIVVLGPSVQASDNDNHTAGGLVLEVNVPGQSGGFFFGGQGLYFLDSEDGQDSHTASARAGIKLPVSKSGLFKVYVSKGMTGRDKDADLTGNLAAVIKF